METILRGTNSPILENMAIIAYGVIALAAVAIAAGWAEQRAAGETDLTNSGDINDYQPEPPEPEPTVPAHGPLPDIEPAEVQGTPYLPALPLWASDNKEAVARADVARFRERTLANMNGIRRVA